jgi:uncharacterized protein with GYD domain
MAHTSIIIGRFSQEGAQQVASNGMAATRDAFAASIAPAPANGRIVSWHAVDDHEWDVVVIVEVDNDDPAYWAKTQLVKGRATGGFAESRLLRLVDLEAFDSIQLPT